MKNLKHLTIAFILIFAGLMLLKQKGSVPLNGAAVEQLSGELEASKNTTTQKPSSSQLRTAYTGQWFKNDAIAENSGSPEQSFDFVKQDKTKTAANKKKDDKKKKAKAKRNTKTKITKYKYNKDGKLVGSDFDFGTPKEFRNNGAVYPRKVVTPVAEEKEIPLTLEQWLELLKSGQGTAKLLAEYRKEKVSSEMFYHIIDKLMQSSEVEENKTGYKLLAGTPSARSFEKHIQYMAQEQEQELQTFAKTQLETYKQVNSVRILNTALNNQEPSLRLAANTLIRELADSLTASLLPNEANGGEIRGPSSVVVRYSPVLQNSLTIINALLTSGSLDGESTTQFTQTKNSLERLLNENANPLSR